MLKGEAANKGARRGRPFTRAACVMTVIGKVVREARADREGLPESEAGGNAIWTVLVYYIHRCSS